MDKKLGIGNYFKYYNNNRPHQSLGYKKPAEIHFEKQTNKSKPSGISPWGNEIVPL